MLSVVLDRTWSFYGTPQGRKLVRYGLVSVVSVGIGFSLLILIYGVLQLWSEVPSALVSNILAAIPNYYLNRKWVWGKSGRSHIWREVVPFWITSITGILLALLTASLCAGLQQCPPPRPRRPHGRDRRGQHGGVRDDLDREVPDPQSPVPRSSRCPAHRSPTPSRPRKRRERSAGGHCGMTSDACRARIEVALTVGVPIGGLRMLEPTIQRPDHCVRRLRRQPVRPGDPIVRTPYLANPCRARRRVGVRRAIHAQSGASPRAAPLSSSSRTSPIPTPNRGSSATHQRTGERPGASRLRTWGTASREPGAAFERPDQSLRSRARRPLVARRTRHAATSSADGLEVLAACFAEESNEVLASKYQMCSEVRSGGQ